MNEPRASRSDLHIAVVGYGSIGRRHFDNLAALGVSRRTLVRRDEPNPAFATPEAATVVHSHDEAIALGIDAAIIANPTRLHLAAAEAYVSGGVPVLIEKPLMGIPCGDDVQRFTTLVRASQTTVAMAYCMRYHPAYRLAQEAIAAGEIGRVLYAKTWFESYLPDWHPWEDYRTSYAARRDLGGGVLPTVDHDIDFLAWCLGLTESASGGSANSGSLGIDADDVATIVLRHAGGAVSTAVMSLCRRDRRRGFEFIGESGTLRYAMEGASETGAPLERIRPGEPTRSLWQDADYDLNTMYRDMLADFLDAIVTGRGAPIPLAAGIDAARACAATLSVCRRPMTKPSFREGEGT